MKTKFISAILSVAVIAGLMMVPAALPGVPAGVALAANNVTIEVLPASQAVLPNDTFNVSVVIDNPDAMDIYGCQARLDFDSSYFNVTGITGGPLFTFVLVSAFDNANGTVDYDAAMPTPPGTPTNATSILVATISCQALAKEGVSTMDFVYQTSAPFRKSMVTLAAFDYLESGNMSLMLSGAVVVGTPKLTVNITPQFPLPSPPYPPGAKIAMGAMGIGYNIIWDMGVPVDWDFLIIEPTDPFPNTTSWSWGEIIIVAAADIVPGWGFNDTVNYTPIIGTLLPGYHEVEYPPLSGNMIQIRPMITVMDALSKSTTAPFSPLPAEINVTPDSLSFMCNEGVDPTDKTLFMVNSGGGTLNWNATTDVGWLSVSPPNGSLTTDWYVEDNVTLNVAVNVSGMNWSVVPYLGNVTITGNPTVIIPVSLLINPATAIDVCRTIAGTGDSGLPGETDELYPGETFNVTVCFTAPVDDFNAIGMTDIAPDGWTVQVDKNWCDPMPYAWLATGNKAEYLWNAISKDVNVTAMYKVTVPTTATPGLNTFGDCDKSRGWLEYYFDVEGPHTSCIMGESSPPCESDVIVTVPGDLVGETFDVNHNELPDTDVRLHLDGVGYLRSDISTPLYVDTAYITGTYFLVSNKTRYFELNANGSTLVHLTPVYIDMTDQTKLAAGNTFNFSGNYGLVPRACDLWYALKSVNLWVMSASYPAEVGLDFWKADQSIHSWQFPS